MACGRIGGDGEAVRDCPIQYIHTRARYLREGVPLVITPVGHC